MFSNKVNSLIILCYNMKHGVDNWCTTINTRQGRVIVCPSQSYIKRKKDSSYILFNLFAFFLRYITKWRGWTTNNKMRIELYYLSTTNYLLTFPTKSKDTKVSCISKPITYRTSHLVSNTKIRRVLWLRKRKQNSISLSNPVIEKNVTLCLSRPSYY